MDLSKRIPGFPAAIKLFLGLFTTLILGVCVWAVWLYTVEQGAPDEAALPEYLQDEPELSLSSEDEIDLIAEDSSIELAPVWDSEEIEEGDRIDTADIALMRAVAETEPDAADDGSEPESRLRHNLGLAHVHVNGQSLLFFALGAVFLFTSVKLRIKKIILVTFGITILVHAVGLSGAGFHWFFDDILAVSGVVMLALIVYMCLMIYVDLGRSRGDRQS